MRISLFALALITLSPTAALADVVDPEPPSCPVGSTPATAHSGPYCRPDAECTSDETCGAGSSCTPVMQCIETRNCGGLSFPDAEPCTLEHVVGPCGYAGACTVGECRTRNVCSGGSTDGCGCRAARTKSGLPFFVLIAFSIVGLCRLRRA